MKLVTGTFKIPGTGGGNIGITINLGFKPDFLFYIGSNGRISIYDSDYSTTQYRWGEKGYPSQSVNFGNNRRSGLYSINEDGFTTMGSYSTYNELYYATKYS